MLLKSIHLKNIKNHKDLKEEFAEGITAIIGRNGMGKTTILEAIGFVLFDYLPYTQKEFITHGKTWGEIRLETDIGSIRRRIGNNPLYHMTQLGCDIKGKEDVQEVIKESLKTDMDLQKLYSEIIAIPQGLATAHFLLPKTQRAQIFDSIMGVDVYRECWAKLLKVEKILKFEIDTRERIIHDLKFRTKDYDEKKSNLEDLIGEIDTLKNMISVTEIAHNHLVDEISELLRVRDLYSDKKWVGEKLEKIKSTIKVDKEELLDVEYSEKDREEVVYKLNKLIDSEKDYHNTVDSLAQLTYNIEHWEDNLESYETEINSFESQMLEYPSLVKLADRFDNIEKNKELKLQWVAQYESRLGELNGILENKKCPVTASKCDKINLSDVRAKIKMYKETLETSKNSYKEYEDKYWESYHAREKKERLDNMKLEIEKITSLCKDYRGQLKDAREKHMISENRLTKLKKDLVLYEELKEKYYKIEASKDRVEQLKGEIADSAEELESTELYYKRILEETADYDENTLDSKQYREEDLRDTLSRLEEQCSQNELQRASEEKEILKLEESLAVLKDDENKLSKSNKTLDKTKKIRKIFNEIGSKLVDSYLNNISYEANQIYQELMNTNELLTWENDYELKVGDKKFNQLSGGQQMCAAISVRIALLKYFSDMKLIILDEPTANLDDERREALAESIQKLEGNQILIVTHDDSFSTITEHILTLRST